MENIKVLNVKMYDETIEGGSMSGNLVEVIGEQTIEYEGTILEQYLYNIIGFTPKNGKPFAALKANIVLFA